MVIEVLGSRSTDSAWLSAQRVPVSELAALAGSELNFALSAGGSAEALARAKLAGLLSLPGLREKAQVTADLVQNWLAENQSAWNVDLIRLNTLSGIFEVSVSSPQRTRTLHIAEDAMDALLTEGSRSAAESLDRLLAANFGRLLLDVAS